jgi:hypothetical protein
MPSIVRSAFASFLLFSALSYPRGASAAEPGLGHESLHVLRLVERGAPAQARAMTAALKTRVLALPDYALANSDLSFEPLAARCHKGPLFSADGSPAGQLSAACLAQIGTFLQERRFAQKAPFLWGVVARKAGGEAVTLRLHLWREGAADATVELSYPPTLDEAAAPALDDLAEWALLRLLRGEAQVGRVRVHAADGATGTLFVDGAPRGVLAAGGERALALALGSHAFELRRDGAVVARGTRQVNGGEDGALTLTPTAPPSSPRPLAPLALDQRTTPAPASAPSALPWVFFGVGAAGLVGAGVFFGLRQGLESDLDELCRTDCPPRARSDVDRANRYGTLSLVSLGVGAASVGIGTFLLLRGSPSPSSSATRANGLTATPTAGGLALGWRGSF